MASLTEPANQSKIVTWLAQSDVSQCGEVSECPRTLIAAWQVVEATDP